MLVAIVIAFPSTVTLFRGQGAKPDEAAAQQFLHDQQEQAAPQGNGPWTTCSRRW